MWWLLVVALLTPALIFGAMAVGNGAAGLYARIAVKSAERSGRTIEKDDRAGEADRGDAAVDESQEM